MQVLSVSQNLFASSFARLRVEYRSCTVCLSILDYLHALYNALFKRALSARDTESRIKRVMCQGSLPPCCLPVCYVQCFLYQILKPSYTFTKHDLVSSFVILLRLCWATSSLRPALMSSFLVTLYCWLFCRYFFV